MESCLVPSSCLLCVSPSEGLNSPECSNPRSGNSLHCSYHRPFALRSYKKYKKVSERVEALKSTLGSGSISHILTLYSALEKECSLRLSHQERFFLPVHQDNGHEIWLKERRALILSCEEILQGLFDAQKEGVMGSIDSPENEVLREPKENVKTSYKRYKKVRRGIRRNVEGWERLEKIMMEERIRENQERAEKEHVAALLFKRMNELLRGQGVDPERMVSFWDHVGRMEGEAGTEYDRYLSRTSDEKEIYTFEIVTASYREIALHMYNAFCISGRARNNVCMQQIRAFVPFRETIDKCHLSYVKGLYEYSLFFPFLITGIIVAIEKLQHHRFYLFIVIKGPQRSLACIPHDQIDIVFQGTCRRKGIRGRCRVGSEVIASSSLTTINHKVVNEHFIRFKVD